MIAAGFEGYFTICGDHTQRAMNQPNRKWAVSMSPFSFVREALNHLPL